MNKTVKIQTDFGHAVVNAERIGSIEFGKPDVIITVGEEELRGRIIAPKSFRIKSGKETRSLRTSTESGKMRFNGKRDILAAHPREDRPDLP